MIFRFGFELRAEILGLRAQVNLVSLLRLGIMPENDRIGISAQHYKPD